MFELKSLEPNAIQSFNNIISLFIANRRLWYSFHMKRSAPESHISYLHRIPIFMYRKVVICCMWTVHNGQRKIHFLFTDQFWPSWFATKANKYADENFAHTQFTSWVHSIVFFIFFFYFFIVIVSFSEFSVGNGIYDMNWATWKDTRYNWALGVVLWQSRCNLPMSSLPIDR